MPVCSARGASVVVHDAGVDPAGGGRDPSVANAVADDIVASGGIAAACHDNLEDPDAAGRIVDLAMQRFGRVDALVLNAGLVVFASLEETTPELWRRMTAIGVDAPYQFARAAIPHMRRQGYGRIVLTTSGRATAPQHCVPGLTAYATIKLAQVGLMVGLAAELGGPDIHVNAIAPVAATRVLRRDAPELRPELVAPGAAFLASSACVTSGIVLHAAGGKFAAGGWRQGAEIDLGREPVTIEDMAANWGRIVGAWVMR
jgi:NAD(P)-dependent dehydrogenase (short-subunit alcohol dehydrogenase family)